MDGKTYQIAGASSTIDCVNASAPAGPCVSCDTHMDYVQLSSAGTCDIIMANDDGTKKEEYTLSGTLKLGFGLPGHPQTISCSPPAVSTREVEITEADSCDASCLGCAPADNAISVFFVTNTSRYNMDVPLGNSYSIAGADPDLHCVETSVGNYPCVSCMVPVEQITVNSAGKVCNITLQQDLVFPIQHHLVVDSTEPVQLPLRYYPISIDCWQTNRAVRDFESSLRSRDLTCQRNSTSVIAFVANRAAKDPT